MSQAPSSLPCQAVTLLPWAVPLAPAPLMLPGWYYYRVHALSFTSCLFSPAKWLSSFHLLIFLENSFCLLQARSADVFPKKRALANSMELVAKWMQVIKCSSLEGQAYRVSWHLLLVLCKPIKSMFLFPLVSPTPPHTFPSPPFTGHFPACFWYLNIGLLM